MIADCQRQPGSGVEAWQPLAPHLQRRRYGERYLVSRGVGSGSSLRVRVHREQALIFFSAAVVVRLPATVMSLLPCLSSQDFGMPNIFLWLKETADHVIDRDASRSPGHDAERHSGPSQMDRPAIGHRELDDQGHEQQSQRGKARS